MVETFGQAVRRLRGPTSQRALARRAFLDPGHLNKIENGVRLPTLDTAKAIDDALQAGGELVALAQSTRAHNAVGRVGRTSTVEANLGGRLGVGRCADAEGAEEPVRRRDLLALASAGLVSGLMPDRTADALDRLAAGLAAATCRGGDRPWTLQRASSAVAFAKGAYQAGHYPEVLAEVPSLLPRLLELVPVSDDESRQRVCRLIADAYHVTASVLLKLGDVGLASVAADRSVQAARRSSDPLAVAASTRIVVHTMMSAGHPLPAHKLAAECVSDVRREAAVTPEAGAVLGALLLRGAIAGARAEDRAIAHQLLAEAERVAGEVGEGDGNLRWTGFSSVNVAMHRVNVALLLGDAGTAIDIGRRIHPSRIALAERRACLHLDMARAYAQWGKWDEAWAALFQAEQAAPHEVRTRPATRRLIMDLVWRAPRSLPMHIRDLAVRAGVEL